MQDEKDQQGMGSLYIGHLPQGKKVNRQQKKRKMEAK